MHHLARLAAVLFLVAPIAAIAQTAAIQVDVPVVLQDAKVVFNLDHAVFVGDEPIGLNYLRTMIERFRSDGTKARIVAVFHGAAGYMLLDDAAFDRARTWQQGNPYKDQIARLLQDGVEFEECGQTMLANHWANAELLPGVKVNTGANFRIIQLVQQGFVQIQP